MTNPNGAIRTVCLEGHTDSVGSPDFNKRLGLARAKKLRGELKKAIFEEAKTTGVPSADYRQRHDTGDEQGGGQSGRPEHNQPWPAAESPG